MGAADGKLTVFKTAEGVVADGGSVTGTVRFTSRLDPDKGIGELSNRDQSMQPIVWTPFNVPPRQSQK